MNIKFKPRTGHLSEAVRYGFEYSLLNDDLEALHQPIQCKDFIQDAFWCEYNKRAAVIYGFNWAPGTIELGKPWYHLGIKYSHQPNLQPWAVPLATFLGAFDKAFGFKYTKVESANNGTALLITFDGAWTKKPILVSTFTQLIRLGVTYDGTTPVLKWMQACGKDHSVLCSEDAGRVPRYITNLKKMMQDGIPEQSYKEYDGIYDVHGRAGLIDFYRS